MVCLLVEAVVTVLTQDISVTWAACVFHWLTLAGTDETEDKSIALVPLL
jgi:hypothetical protein